jgi:uncharacterized repeat protein (TIGR03803 family)
MIDQTSLELSLCLPTLGRRIALISRWSALKTAAAMLLCLATSIPSPAQTFETLVSFDGANGGNSYGGVVQGTDGNLYGTTGSGGTRGSGTVFKVTTGGTLTTLHSFIGSDGAIPRAGLVQGMDGGFYGTTWQGGAFGDGTFFKITAGGVFTVLYSFCAEALCADGGGPVVALVQGINGNFYGTNSGGGAYGYGTVFEMTPTGKLTTLHSFLGSPDGYGPIGSLLQDDNGTLYGTTFLGGTYDNGTVFKMSPTGEESILYNFCSQTNCSDGSWPEAALILGANGSFYSTTSQGGSIGVGTVFELTGQGKLTTLYNFGAVGGNPVSPLVLGTDGNFYGTVLNGDEGIIEISSAGELKNLHSFTGTDGSNPYAGLLQDTNGTFYGTTLYGANDSCETGCGTVFSLATGLGPFVQTRPTSGKVGAKVIILGTNLAGTTAVGFNGTAATFTASNSAIQTTVPAGATTGTITVNTPTGTLSSNVAFRVRP